MNKRKNEHKEKGQEDINWEEDLHQFMSSLSVNEQIGEQCLNRIREEMNKDLYEQGIDILLDSIFNPLICAQLSLQNINLDDNRINEQQRYQCVCRDESILNELDRIGMQGFDGMNWDGIAGKDKVKYKWEDIIQEQQDNIIINQNKRERWGDLVEDEIEDQCTLNEHNILNDCKMVCEDQCSSLTNEDQQLKECVSQIRRYLVADSAKDCSIVLRFQPIEDENPEKQQSSEHSKVLCGINVIDLAPKVHKRISRWVKLERRLGLVVQILSEHNSLI